jgi:hypothetical protein
MTEATARDAAKESMAITAATMGHDFLAAMLTELRSMPGHWAALNAEKQQEIIGKLKEKIQAGIETAVRIMLTSEFPAVQADVDHVSFKGGIVAGLKIPKDAPYRHQLADAQGMKVLVVISDPQRWMNRMDEIKARGDQIDLFDADYDPARDQPGYRRDKDPLLPAGPTWADLKKSLTGETKPGESETKPPESETTAADQSEKQPVPPPELPSEYKAEAAAAMERRKADGEWELVKLKHVARGDAIKIPGFDAVFITKTPSLKGKDGIYTIQVKPEPALIFGSDMTGDQEKRADVAGLQEALAKVGVVLSLGALNGFTREQFAATSAWLEEYAQSPAGQCKIARPLWIPIPDLKGDAS